MEQQILNNATDRPKKLTVIMLEDDRLNLKLLSDTLNASDEVVCLGCYEDTKTCLEGLKTELPDALLLDIKLSNKDNGTDGIKFCGQVRTLYPDLKILMLSSYGEYTFVKKAVEYGANGYVWKNSSSPELIIAAIRAVVAGETVSPVELSQTQSNEENPFGLTGRQMEILEYLNEGMTQAEIADKISRSDDTVKCHVENIKKKVGVRKTSELIREINRLKWHPIYFQ